MWSCFGEEEEEGMKILDPQGPFLVKWNKFMLLLCLLAVSLDPLFLYIPVINDDKKCLGRDRMLEVTAIVLRSFTDIFYIIHIIFQFRTGFIAPSSRVFGRGDLVEDAWEIAKRYLSSYFLIDMLAVLPLPQVLVLAVRTSLNTTKVLKYAIFVQYFPRLVRIYPFYKEVIISSGWLTRSAWTGPALNLFLYMLAGHVIGAFWYVLSIERGTICWSQACGNQTQFNQKQCVNSLVHCDDDDNNIRFKDFLNVSCPIETPNPKLFDYGIFIDSLQSGALGSINFLKKSSYCFWWGLQNLSSFGQNLKTSTDQQEVYFAVFISISGLVLFSFLIGNMQTFLQSTAQRLEEARAKQSGAELWMSSCSLPEGLRERVRRYQHYKWRETKGVDGEAIISDLPRDLRLDIKRHRYLNLLRRVPLFEEMDEQIFDALCDCLKPLLFTKDSYIVREGDRVHEMFFITRGKLLTVTTNGGRTGFFNSVYLKAGDFCGEELLTWALETRSSAANLPISTRTVKTLSEVECITLMPNDLKFAMSQSRRLHSKQFRYTFRFYSQQWRTWAACFIQAAWRRHCRKKLEKSLREEEDRLRDALARQGGGSSSSLGATIYASRFAANALKALRSNVAQRAMVPENIIPRHALVKPAEFDLNSET